MSSGSSSSSASDDKEVQRLYEVASKLDGVEPGASTVEHERLYDEILASIKGSKQGKTLSAQFIPKYLKLFPKHVERAINALMDLCEDEDDATRVNAIRALPVIAQDTPEHLPRLADILGQLLQAENHNELDNVKHALMSLMRIDTKGTLEAILIQIASDDESLRAKAISFLSEKVLPAQAELINSNDVVQQVIADNIKKLLSDVSPSEFKFFMDWFGSLPLFKNKGAIEILDPILDQFDAQAEFKISDPESSSKLTGLLRVTVTHLQQGAIPTRLVKFIASKVLGQLTEQQLPVLKSVTEMTPFASADDAKLLLPPLFDLIKVHIPSGGDPQLNFSIIECLLYSFHQLGAKAPGHLRSLAGYNINTGQPSDLKMEVSAEARKDFQERLKFLQEKIKSYIPQVRAAISAELQKKVTEEEKKAHTARKETLLVASKTTTNIEVMVPPLQLAHPEWVASGALALSFQLKPTKATRTLLIRSNPEKNKLSGEKRKAEVPLKVPKVPKAPEEKPVGSEPTAKARPQGIYLPPRKAAGELPAAKAKAPAAGAAAANTTETTSNKKFKGRGTSKYAG